MGVTSELTIHTGALKTKCRYLYSLYFNFFTIEFYHIVRFKPPMKIIHQNNKSKKKNWEALVCYMHLEATKISHKNP